MRRYEVAARVQAAFNRAARSYDHFNQLQRTVACRLINRLSAYCSDAKFAVDLGCGSGGSTALLSDRIHCQHIVAVDIADKLLEQAQRKLQSRGVTICFGNFNQALFPPATVDLIIANMSLQWSADFSWTLKRLYSQMTWGGVLAFTLPVDGTFVELQPEFRNVFSGYSEICELLQREAFNVLSSEHSVCALSFDSPLKALQSIKRVGANCLLHQCNHNGLRGQRKLCQIFQKTAGEDRYELTYSIAYLIVEKR